MIDPERIMATVRDRRRRGLLLPGSSLVDVPYVGPVMLPRIRRRLQARTVQEFVLRMAAIAAAVAPAQRIAILRRRLTRAAVNPRANICVPTRRDGGRFYYRVRDYNPGTYLGLVQTLRVFWDLAPAGVLDHAALTPLATNTQRTVPGANCLCHTSAAACLAVPGCRWARPPWPPWAIPLAPGPQCVPRAPYTDAPAIPGVRSQQALRPFTPGEIILRPYVPGRNVAWRTAGPVAL
jgi:hypothetical protein